MNDNNIVDPGASGSSYAPYALGLAGILAQLNRKSRGFGSGMATAGGLMSMYDLYKNPPWIMHANDQASVPATSLTSTMPEFSLGGLASMFGFK